MKPILLIATIVSFLFCSCGAPAPQAVEPTPVEQAAPQDDGNVQIEGLYGKIDDSIVEQTFDKHLNGLLACYEEEALEILEEIEGTLTVFILVDRYGHVTEQYFEDGNFGSEAAQSCMLQKIRRIQFQEPIGGTKAEIHYTIPFEEPYNHPAPFDWSGEKVETIVSDNQAAVDQCLNGISGVTLTLYVGFKGKVVAAGGVADSLEGYEAARCLSNVVKTWKFPNPGKRRPAKATIHF